MDPRRQDHHNTPKAPRQARNVTQDAVVVVPGIMGSELKETTTGRTIWGLSGASWLLKAWLTPKGLKPLQLTEDELEGRYGRVRPAGLLRASAWTPYFQGVEPYRALVDAVGSCVADPAAVLQFGYDWRLPVAVNARLLADAARTHLTAWRRHPAHDAARRHRVDERPARLVFVAHSMGGLVTRAALDPAYDSDLAADTRGVYTLGTPFSGAVKATAILNSGRGAPMPLPHVQLRTAAATMPGLYDLLPQYRCLHSNGDVRRLTPGDIADIGGLAPLAEAADAFHRDQKGLPLPGHRAVVGTTQPTWQSLTIRDGVVETHHHGVRQHSNGDFIRDSGGRPRLFDVQGDGTVYKESASLGPAITPLPLHHGAVASDPVALNLVKEMLREDEHLGPPQGTPGCGLDVPDLVEAGSAWTVTLNDVDSLSGIDCQVSDVETGHTMTPQFGWQDGELVAGVTVDRPGLYRVTVRTIDARLITELVLAAPPKASGAEEPSDCVS
ncbi:lipase/acyltransferase domain-containing protein [Streptomyces sp. NPDC054933]